MGRWLRLIRLDASGDLIAPFSCVAARRISSESLEMTNTRWLHASVCSFLVVFVLAPKLALGEAKPGWYRDKTCVNSYSDSEGFLQFFYKIDGNLAEINPSKIKRIEYLERQWREDSVSETSRKSAFKELYNDADYWHYKLQRQIRKLISTTEALVKNFGWENFKELADLQSSGKISGPSQFVPHSGTGAMRAMLDFYQEELEVFELLDEVERHLERFGQSARLAKALPEDGFSRGYAKGFWRHYGARLLNCQIDYLAYAMSRNKK